MSTAEKYKDRLTDMGLKVTPQRIAVLEAMNELKSHPSTDAIIDYIRRNHPSIATGTVYKTLELFVDKGILKRVKTEKDVMRYDSVTEKHHHLYCFESNRIEDYYDDELNRLITDYFRQKKIPNFTVQDVKLQISGKFLEKNP